MKIRVCPQILVLVPEKVDILVPLESAEDGESNGVIIFICCLTELGPGVTSNMMVLVDACAPYIQHVQDDLRLSMEQLKTWQGLE